MPFRNFLSHRYSEKALEEKAAIEYGEHLFRTGILRPFGSADENSTRPAGAKKSFREKLNDLYWRENRNHKYPEFKANLLQRLVREEKLNVVIVNLYSMDYGITIEISGHHSTPMVLPYEYPTLECIDRGELHPSFVDQLKNLNVFYKGCVIAEIRDYRRSDAPFGDNPSYNSHYVVLKPTNQTFYADLCAMAPENECSREDRLRLESELLCAISGPLCLDPNPAVAVIANRVQYYKNSFHRPSLKRIADEYRRAAINKKKSKDVSLPSYLENCKPLSKIKNIASYSSPNEIFYPTQLEIPIMDPSHFVSRAFGIPNYSNATAPSNDYQKCIKIKRSSGLILYAKIGMKEMGDERNFIVTQKFRYEGQEEFKENPELTFASRELAIKYLEQFYETFTEKGNLALDSHAELQETVDPVDTQRVTYDTVESFITNSLPPFSVGSTLMGKASHCLASNGMDMDYP